MLLLDTEGLLPDLKTLLMGEEDYAFLIQVLVRSVIMFFIVVIGLRLMGKRGIKQLSVFELVIILTLGSAAGDPMFYKEVGLLNCALVFLIILGLYKAIIRLMVKSKKIEYLLEGKPICLIVDGIFCIDNFKKEDLPVDEFFSELRVQYVSQLGQIREAYLETSGEISIFFYDDDEVKPGLTILPNEYMKHQKEIHEKGSYACAFCGTVKELEPTAGQQCTVCGRREWLKASKRKRLS